METTQSMLMDQVYVSALIKQKRIAMEDNERLRSKIRKLIKDRKMWQIKYFEATQATSNEQYDDTCTVIHESPIKKKQVWSCSHIF